MKIVHKPSPHQWSRDGRVPHYIVIHTTEGQRSWSDTVDYMLGHPRNASYHVLCSPYEAIVFVPYDRTAAHVGYGTLPNGAYGYEANRQSVGISMWNTAGGVRPAEQTIINAASMTAAAMEELGLGIERVISHKQADPGRRTDPSGVDMGEFKALVMQQISGGPPMTPADEAYLKETGRQLATTPITPGFLLFDAIQNDGLVPNGPEDYGHLPSGVKVAMRSAESWDGTEKWTYFVPVPPINVPWGKAQRIQR